jgi:hypothetical protein
VVVANSYLHDNVPDYGVLMSRLSV